MLHDTVLTKLSQLNLQSRLNPGALAPAPRATTERPDASTESLIELSPSELPAGIEVETPVGKHWLRERTLREIWPDGQPYLSRAMASLSDGPIPKPIRVPSLRALAASLPSRAIYLDLETCGFAGSMVFLIGLLDWHEGEFRLSQLLARHYGEEKAVFHSLWERMADKQVLATFNGKSFDWPMVLDRSTLHRLPVEARFQNRHEPSFAKRVEPWPNGSGSADTSFIHCDLLHHARRRWKGKLPDCKLQTLERHICRRRRSGDIPGREIPAAYHDFVRSGDAWLLRSVLHHNALDLVTLLQLSLKICLPSIHSDGNATDHPA